MKNNTLIIVFLLVLSALPAQTRHILHGYLLDEQGQPISGVRLEALQSLNYFSESDKNGHFQFSIPDLGHQDLKVTVLTSQYAIYNNNSRIGHSPNSTVISAEKQKEGIVNIFMTNTLQGKSRGAKEHAKAVDLIEEEDEETRYYTTSYKPISKAISLSSQANKNTVLNNTVENQTPARLDSPIIEEPPLMYVPEENEAKTEQVERGLTDNAKRYEVQIAAISIENTKLKTRYEQITGKTVNIRNKNGRYIYIVPVSTAEEGRELISKLSTSQMEQEGIKQPFMVIAEPIATSKPQKPAEMLATRDIDPKMPPKVAEKPVENKPKNTSEQAIIPTPAPKVMPVPQTPAFPSKPQYILQLQSSRFPMNSVAKRMLEADLSKIGETLFEYNDPNADIKYRYYVMHKFSSVPEAEVLRAKLSEAGIESLILTDRMKVEFK